MLMPWLRTTAEAYRKRAKAMRKLAETRGAHSRDLLVRLADYYDRMAAEVEGDQYGSDGDKTNAA